LCSGHSLSAAGARHFSRALQRNKTLKRLALGCAKFGDEAACALFEDWNNSTLEHLDLEYKSLGEAGMAQLAATLQSPTHGLRRLLLGRNELDDKGAAALAAGLGHSSTLELVDLRSNQIGAEGCAAIGAALASAQGASRGLTLVLDENPIGADGLQALVKPSGSDDASGQEQAALFVEELSLESCAMDNQAVAGLVDAMKRAGSAFAGLAKLRLGSNQLTDGASLAAALQNGRLTSLSLHHNKLGAQGAAELAAGLGRQTLRLLDLSSNSISGDDEEPFAQLVADLTKPGVAEEIRLLGNPLGDRGAIAVCAALEDNETLSTLSLGGVGLTMSGLRACLEKLAKNKGLKTLELGGNDVGFEGRELVESFTSTTRPDLDIALDKNPNSGETQKGDQELQAFMAQQQKE